MIEAPLGPDGVPVLGDITLRGLRTLDEVAYIRYAIVYLNLKDIESVKGEIEKLLGER